MEVNKASNVAAQLLTYKKFNKNNYISETNTYLSTKNLLTKIYKNLTIHFLWHCTNLQCIAEPKIHLMEHTHTHTHTHTHWIKQKDKKGNNWKVKRTYSTLGWNKQKKKCCTLQNIFFNEIPIWSLKVVFSFFFILFQIYGMSFSQGGIIFFFPSDCIYLRGF